MAKGLTSINLGDERDPVAHQLGNFAAAAFVVDGVECASAVLKHDHGLTARLRNANDDAPNQGLTRILYVTRG